MILLLIFITAIAAINAIVRGLPKDIPLLDTFIIAVGLISLVFTLSILHNPIHVYYVDAKATASRRDTIWIIDTITIVRDSVMSDTFRSGTDAPNRVTTDQFVTVELLNDYRRLALQSMGGVVIILGLYFTYKRVRAIEKTTHITEQGHITDRLTKAVEQLADDRRSVQIGAVFALERIARDSDKDLRMVIDILAAYIRNDHVRWKGENSHDDLQQVTREATAALAVISRLNKQNPVYRPIDLKGAFLKKADLSGLYLNLAHFDGAELAFVDFTETFLKQSSFNETNLYKANFRSADLSNATLKSSNGKGAIFSYADCYQAQFRRSKLNYAEFIKTKVDQANFNSVTGLTRNDLNLASGTYDL